MLKTHAIFSVQNGVTTTACGRKGTPLLHWDYLSMSGKTRFGAMWAHEETDLTPSITCDACKSTMCIAA